MYDEDYNDRPLARHLAPRKLGKPLGRGERHIPNKAERKLLTQMMQKSGQTEEEVRKSKSNRQKLAKARASMSGPKPTSIDMEGRRLKRRIMSFTGLKHYDPRLETILRHHRATASRWRSSMYLGPSVRAVLGDDWAEKMGVPPERAIML